MTPSYWGPGQVVQSPCGRHVLSVFGDRSRESREQWVWDLGPSVDL